MNIRSSGFDYLSHSFAPKLNIMYSLEAVETVATTSAFLVMFWCQLIRLWLLFADIVPLYTPAHPHAGNTFAPTQVGNTPAPAPAEIGNDASSSPRPASPGLGLVAVAMTVALAFVGMTWAAPEALTFA